MSWLVDKNPERVAKGLEERADITNSYNHVLWETARQNKLKKQFQNGQQTLTDHMTILSQSTVADYVNEPVNREKVLCDDFNNTISSISNQKRFTINGGEINMETHDSLDVDTRELPENETLNGEVTEIHTGRRDELNENFDSSEAPEWANADDDMVRIVIEVDYRGDKLTHSETVAYYDEPDPRSNLGAWIRRYGNPEIGQEVNVDYNSDSEGSVVLPN